MIIVHNYHLNGCILPWGNQGQGPTRPPHAIEHIGYIQGQYPVHQAIFASAFLAMSVRPGFVFYIC
jgi:hypothetical protein